MENTQNSQEARSINVFEILQELWSNKILIIVLMILGGLLLFAKVQFFTDDTFTSQGRLLVSNRTQKVSDNYYISQNDIQTARALSETYIEILRTRDFLEDVGTVVDNKYSWKQLDRMINCTIVNETELLKVTVTAGNAEEAHKIAQAYLAKGAEKLMALTKGCEVDVVDSARLPTSADDKGMMANVVIGIFMGFVIGAAIALVKFFSDNKVRKSEDVIARYDISILGELAD